MITQYKEWFLENIKDKIFTREDYSYKNVSRKYEYYNFGREEVPFDLAFQSFLESIIGDDDFTYECYHVHRWKVGDFFEPHHDNRENRKFSYVCELQESDCKTKLLVENKPINEGWFDVNTYHEVPMIQSGERISLTIFGKNKKHISLI